MTSKIRMLARNTRFPIYVGILAMACNREGGTGAALTGGRDADAVDVVVEHVDFDGSFEEAGSNCSCPELLNSSMIAFPDGLVDGGFVSISTDGSCSAEIHDGVVAVGRPTAPHCTVYGTTALGEVFEAIVMYPIIPCCVFGNAEPGAAFHRVDGGV